MMHIDTENAVSHNARDRLPRIPLNLREHKRPVAITFTVLVLSSGILPVVLYFALRYGAHLEQIIAMAIPSALFGVTSLFSLLSRTWSLARPNSTTRPIGAKGWHLDYFQINFITLFAIITALVTTSVVISSSETKHNLSLRLFSMPLPLIMTTTCAQLAAIRLIMLTVSQEKLRYPFRISSMTKGEIARPATFTIAEDIVAVDGKQGTDFRIQWDKRYQASDKFRSLLRWSDSFWGISGLILGIVLMVIIWATPDPRIGYVLAWITPWCWAGTATVITIMMTKQALRNEDDDRSLPLESDPNAT